MLFRSRITNVNNLGSINTTVYPSSTTSWTTINTGAITICSLTPTNPASTAGSTVTWSIEVRSVTVPANLVASSITFVLDWAN